ncbi:hypothetical protein, partial [Streptomyces sp. AF1A]|uniref:hypothetical protein n=1 Tax=Streptomyces sp. AF1A TaxID=3394350 RepID=UPI0039BCF173
MRTGAPRAVRSAWSQQSAPARGVHALDTVAAGPANRSAGRVDPRALRTNGGVEAGPGAAP